MVAHAGTAAVMRVPATRANACAERASLTTNTPKPEGRGPLTLVSKNDAGI